MKNYLNNTFFYHLNNTSFQNSRLIFFNIPNDSILREINLSIFLTSDKIEHPIFIWKVVTLLYTVSEIFSSIFNEKSNTNGFIKGLILQNERVSF